MVGALPDDKKKAVVKAKMERKMKKLQAKMDFLKEMKGFWLDTSFLS